MSEVVAEGMGKHVRDVGLSGGVSGMVALAFIYLVPTFNGNTAQQNNVLEDYATKEFVAQAQLVGELQTQVKVDQIQQRIEEVDKALELEEQEARHERERIIDRIEALERAR